jgi:hypothetical protein
VEPLPIISLGDGVSVRNVYIRNACETNADLVHVLLDINLPFGAVTAAFIIPFFSINRRGKKSEATFMQQVKKFDLEGTALFLPAIICLLLALQWGGSKYEWKSGRIIALLVIFVVLIIGFIAIQWWKQEDATVPPRVFLNRNVWGSALFGAMLGAAFFIMVYYLRKFLALAKQLGHC